MLDLLIAITLLICVALGVRCWLRFGDPLHPAIFISPLFAYSYAIEPWLLREQLSRWFPDEDILLWVVLFNLLGVAAFAAGISRSRWAGMAKWQIQQQHELPRLYLLSSALALSLVAFLAYAYTLANVGGFAAAYSRAKGGGYAGSGYIGEAMNLGLVGALFVGLARRRVGLRLIHWMMLLLGIAPNLLQGTFGGRRGPLFLALGVTMLAAVLAARRQPSVAKLTASVLAICLAVLFVWSQRQHLHLGADELDIRWERLADFATATDADQGNNFIYGTGHVLTAMETKRYSWGREILVNTLIRPIPRQLWPTKYQDVGATWITESTPGYGNFSAREWNEAVGWVPLGGSSAGTLSDLFGEFSWFAIGVFYAVGSGFSYVYWKHRSVGGLWSLLLLESLTLTIYLATQSFSAFYYRLLILAVPTVLVWKFFIEPRLRRRSTTYAGGKPSQPALFGESHLARSATDRPNTARRQTEGLYQDRKD
ncbi:MAG: oligosaccharide repeat unit polymerase [Candidatus Paceibacterota bacterium]